jgi:hypothetical protein
MTFDEWAERIAKHVSAELPEVSVKRKIDDVCRWIYAGRECQLHALSDSQAAFVALRRNGLFTDCPFWCHISIAAESEEEIARRIVGWFAR